MTALDVRHCMLLKDAIAVGRTWLKAGGNPRLDIAALEPLMWRDGAHRIGDLVRAMTDLGFAVAVTTNGHLLSQHAKSLADAGLSKLRVSWHTTNPVTFRQISATGDYASFLKGLARAQDVSLHVSFNRVLLRGHTDDLADHVGTIDEMSGTLKLYDLLWTPESADQYRKYYINAIDATNAVLSSLSVSKIEDPAPIGRRRIRFGLPRGGVIEVKESEQLSRRSHPCATCTARENCLEAFGDYVRVEPNMRMYFCYLRRDIGFDLRPILDRDDADGLHRQLDAATQAKGYDFLRHSRLRYIAVPACNFNCGFPATAISWCHKATGNFQFPSRLINVKPAA